MENSKLSDKSKNLNSSHLGFIPTLSKVNILPIHLVHTCILIMCVTLSLLLQYFCRPYHITTFFATDWVVSIVAFAGFLAYLQFFASTYLIIQVFKGTSESKMCSTKVLQKLNICLLLKAIILLPMSYHIFKRRMYALFGYIAWCICEFVFCTYIIQRHGERLCRNHIHMIPDEFREHLNRNELATTEKTEKSSQCEKFIDDAVDL